MARITVVGAGYVGLTAGVCLASLGHQVWVLDIDEARIQGLQDGRVPIPEPGLDQLLLAGLQSGRLHFTSDSRLAVKGSQMVFIAVGTPSGGNGEANLAAVLAVVHTVVEHLEGDIILVNKSTVPPGSGDMVTKLVSSLHSKWRVAVVSNPEFMREGSALEDFMHPDRVVVGSTDGQAAKAVAALYESLGAPMLVMAEIQSAEMIKYAANAYLATRVSFINEIAQICEAVGADARLVEQGLGLDHRIGPDYLEAGIGWGGSCLPKDVKALEALAKAGGHHPELLRAVQSINADMQALVVRKLASEIDLKGATIGLLGLAFKPNTDDVRDSPALAVGELLLQQGCHLKAHDPVAMAGAAKLLDATYCADSYDLALDVDALVLCTAWPEFTQLDWGRMARLARQRVFVDGRNFCSREHMRAVGWRYCGIGR